MTEQATPPERQHGSLNAKKTLLVCVLTLLVAAGVIFVIFSTEPTAQRETATRTSAMLVNVVEVHRGTHRPVIVGTGVVGPAKDIELSPQVNGLITEVHPEFVPGGFIDRGETVVRIEPDDYENLLRQRESALLQAETELRLEMGRQEIARQDFELFGEVPGADDPSLVLREPQLEAARVRVDAARSAVDQARLDLERTTLQSPFDAQVLSRSVNLGSQVNSGQPIARLIGVETYWVTASVPLSKVSRLQFPESGGDGATVELINRSNWAPGVTRKGRLFKLIGALEAGTRLARVVIEVNDPLARSAESADVPPLLVGEYLEARIEGRPVENVIRLDREYVRTGDTAWVMDDENKLRIRTLEIVFTDAAHAYVRSGLEDGDRVVTTSLSAVTDGAALRLESDQRDESENEAETDAEAETPNDEA